MIAPTIIHALALRETAEIRVEVLADSRIRLGIWRRSPSADDPADFTLTAGFAVDVADARELGAAIRLAVATIEADAGDAAA